MTPKIWGFDESRMARSYKRQQPIEFCKRCNGYYSVASYSRAPSCSNCGSKMHAQESCQALTKCSNYEGPTDPIVRNVLLAQLDLKNQLETRSISYSRLGNVNTTRRSEQKWPKQVQLPRKSLLTPPSVLSAQKSL